MFPKENGQVITFYSFKGGTGRSMALANLACLLASRCQSGKGVLMVDWDLEAPGLHRYFYKHLSQKSEVESEKVLEDSQGLIELFCEVDTLLTSESSEVSAISETETSKVLSRLALEKYAIKTNIPSLSLLKAGRFDEAYSTRVNTFDWEKLHGKAPGIFRAFAQLLSEQYEYVLIDSRTGLTDTSGICTMLLPEKLVVVFTPNRQSLTGVRNLMETAADYRKQSDDLRPLLMFPLVSRLEPTENTLRQYWRHGNGDLGITGYQGQFESCFRKIYGLQSCSLETYFDEVLVQHVPSYAYGEEIAVLGQGSSDGIVLKRRYENLLEYLLRPIPPWVSKELPRQGAKSEQQTAGTDEPDLQSTCPYPGLRPFEENEHRFFFAREKITERLLKSLRSSPRFLALFGPSGSGKTSLINAGLIPRLRSGDLPASEQWKIIVCRLRRDPFENLKVSGLQGAEDNLPMAVTKFLGNTPIHPYLLLVIDQFEDLFTIVEDAMRGNFIEQLIRLLSSDVPCIVLVAMRADFYVQFVRDIPGMLPWLEERLINLPTNLSREELRDIVEIPAQVSGVSFEEGLVETIVNDAVSASSSSYGGENSVSSSMLPLLQFSLIQLWEGKREGYLSHFAYQEIGGLAGGLVRHAERSFLGFSMQDKELVKYILTSLVYIRENSIVHRRSRLLSEFDKNSRVVIERLIDARLVFISEKEGQEKQTIELAHEVLINHWPRMREWLDVSRKALIDRSLLESRAQKWAEMGKPWFSGLTSGRERKDFARAGIPTDLTKEYLNASFRGQVIKSAALMLPLVLMLTAGIWLYSQKDLTVNQALLKAQSTVMSIHIEPTMNPVSNGTFQQVDIKSRFSGERPLRTVKMKAFHIGQTEVTFDEYDRFVIATGREFPPDQGWGRGSRPVINVSWNNATDYADWLSQETHKRYRLPTESEWEYAARSGGKNEAWAGISDEAKLQDYAVYERNFDQGTEPVGEKKANGLGLYDMSGNVWEWVADCWHDTYEGAPKDGSAWLEADGGDCSQRVIRGGAWNNVPETLRASTRNRNYTANRYDVIGFRLAQDIS